jgi:hypothetical protein
MPTPDPLAHVRANPDLYLPGGRAEPSDFATRLAGDALTLGANRTLAVRHGDWWAVAADIDWLTAAPVAIHDLFARIVPFPQSGPNAMRSEVLLGAYADHVITWSGPTSTLVKGSAADIHPLRTSFDDPSWRRVIAFRIEAARPAKARAVSATTA